MSASEATSAVDSVRIIQTPEGVAIDLPVAGLPVRATAFLVDLAIRLAFVIIALMVAAVLGTSGDGPLLVGLFLLEWFYPVLFEVFRDGVTPGKQLCGLRVVHQDGTAVSLSGSMLRNTLRVADFFPMVYTTGMLTMLVDRDFRRLGDLAAGTVVIHTRPSRRRVAIAAGPRLQIPTPLSTDEQRAVLAFAERSRGLSPERAAELADTLAPLLHSAGVTGDGQARVEALVSMARWLHERR